MSEEISPTPSDPTPAPLAATPPAAVTVTPPGGSSKPPTGEAVKPRRRRRWPYIVGGILLLLILLVLLLPTIASTGAVRSVVLGKVNNSLDGHVEVQSWSLSWTGAQQLKGVKVFDASGAQIGELEQVTTHLSLLDAIQGKYDLGDTSIVHGAFNVRRYADGSLNWQKLAKSKSPSKPNSPAPAPTPAEDKPAEAKKPTRVPYFSGDVKLVDCRVTYDAEGTAGGKAHSLEISSINGSAKVTDPNAPITDVLSMAIRADQGTSGQLTLEGTVDVINNNQIEFDTATARQAVTLKSLSGGAITAMLPPGGPLSDLSGLFDGNVQFDLNAGKTATFSLNLGGKGLVVSSPSFKGGEKFTGDLAAVIPTSTLDMTAGLGQWEAWNIRIGSGEKDTAGIKLTRDNDVLVGVTLSSSSTPGVLLDLAENMPPTASTYVRVEVSSDIGKLSAGMPKTFGVRNGVALQSGIFRSGVYIASAPNKADITSSIELRDIAGTKDGKPLAFEPISVAFKGSTFGGGWQVPDLRDFVIEPKGPGLSGSIQGKSIAEVQGNIHIILARLQSELDQVWDFGDLQLKGDVAIAVGTQGNLIPTTAPAGGPAPEVRLSLTARDFEARGFTASPIVQEYYNVSLGAKVIRSASGAMDHLEDARLVSLLGNEQKPIARVDVLAPRVQFNASRTAPMLQRIPDFQLTATTPDLPRFQAAFAPASATTQPAASARATGALFPTLLVQATSAPPVTRPASQPADAKPPLRVTAGSATLRLNYSTQGGRATVVSDVVAPGLAFNVGDVAHTVGDVTLKTSAMIQSDAVTTARKPLMEQIREIQVPQFSVTGIGAAISLKEPAMIREPSQLAALYGPVSPTRTGPASGASIAAWLTGTGDLAALMDLSDALAGRAPRQQYAGRFELDEKLSTPAAGIKADGGLVVHDFVAKDERKTDAFREAILRLVNNVTLEGKNDALAIDRLAVAMESSKAMSLDIKGRISALSTARRFEGAGVTGDLTYDLAQLWPILHPMLAPVAKPGQAVVKDPYKDLKIAGKFTRQFVVQGSYPTGVSFNQAIASLSAHGGIAVDLLEIQGMTIQTMDLPIWLEKGIVQFKDPTKPADAAFPKPFACNGGLINVATKESPLWVDLNGDHPRLSGPPNLKLLENVSLNTIFSDFLSGMINNPLFVDPQEAAGTLNLTLEQLARLPIDGRVNDYDPTNDGKAIINISINRVQIGNPTLTEIARAAGGLSIFKKSGFNESSLKSLQGDIKSYKLTIEHGVTSHDMLLTFGEQDRPLRLYGNVRMDTRQLNLAMSIPPKAMGLSGEGLPSIELPFTGTLTAPQFNVQAAFQSTLGNLVKDPLANPDQMLDLLNQFGKKDKKKGKDKPAGDNPQAGTQPAEKPDALGILGDLLNKKAKDKEEKERKKRDSK